MCTYDAGVGASDCAELSDFVVLLGVHDEGSVEGGSIWCLWSRSAKDGGVLFAVQVKTHARGDCHVTS